MRLLKICDKTDCPNYCPILLAYTKDKEKK